ncbi:MULTISPECIES: hypothetical protein [Sulfolobaceae]|uniref:hypothetical protein n=1 Tax=Sulfolobaceae TaxID=118883 RepID=UPI0012EA7B4C|nr:MULTISPECIES: hypothetical protein [unclassified Sulfolobus]
MRQLIYWDENGFDFLTLTNDEMAKNILQHYLLEIYWHNMDEIVVHTLRTLIKLSY